MRDKQGVGLTQRPGYLKELGVTYLWLLPIYPTLNRDKGYEVRDYHGSNHSSGEHPSLKAAPRDERAHLRNYYLCTEAQRVAVEPKVGRLVEVSP